jgi:hypothetical protein
LTKSRQRVQLGADRPRVEHVPPADSNDAADAIRLATSYGLTPDAWQERVLGAWLGCRVDGKYSSPRCGLAVPRQNGKNGVLEVRELFGMILLAERILHTAHEVKTARKAFARLLEFFDNPRQYPELAAMVREIRKTNGQEAIVLHNGGSVEFIARSRGSGRGFSVDVLVLDEAQELSEDALAALQPTISASANPQTIFTGTPPGPKAVGEVFKRVRAAGVKGEDKRLCWQEWSCERGADVDDRGNWFATNPALNIRLDIETIEDEHATQDRDTFGRERLGEWPEEDEAAWEVIAEPAWVALSDLESEPRDPVAFGFDVNPERTAGSISVSGANARGLAHVETVAHEGGVDWIVEVLARASLLHKHIGVFTDANGPAAALIPALARRGVKVTALGGQDVERACAGFFDAAENKRLAHRLDEPLTAALGLAHKKTNTEGAYRWSRRDLTTDISPLYSATFALFGHASAPAPRKFWGTYG